VCGWQLVLPAVHRGKSAMLTDLLAKGRLPKINQTVPQNSEIIRIFIRDSLFTISGGKYFMTQIKYFCIVCFALSIVWNFGCGPKKPEGFPNVVAYTIVVNNDGQPENDVSIFLFPDNAVRGAWVAGGKTNTSGQSVLVTSQGAYYVKGIPEGKYQMCLNKKLPDPPSKVSENEYKKMSNREKETYGEKMRLEREKIPLIVPSILTKPETTPISIDVSANGETVIDLKDYRKEKEFPEHIQIPVQKE
jgi:hypothetical protein